MIYTSYPVYSNDEFTIEYGLERKLTHKPAFSNPQGRGLIVGFYSVAILKDGTRAFEYISLNCPVLLSSSIIPLYPSCS